MLCTLWEPFCLFPTPSPLAHESREGVWGERGALLHRVKVQRGFCQSLEDVAFASCVGSAIRDRACRLPCCP